MPFVDHNAPRLLEFIKQESDEVRKRLRKLRHLVEQGHINYPPEELLTELGRHTGLLSNAIRQYTIRHNFVDQNDSFLFSTYEDPISFVALNAMENPSLISTPVDWEYDIYKELGFSEQEFRDLEVWKNSYEPKECDYVSAFDHFADYVVRELQKARCEINPGDIVPGIAGIIGIATDITFFVTSANVPALVSSCTTGLAAIAAKFPTVRKKLLGRGKDL